MPTPKNKRMYKKEYIRDHSSEKAKKDRAARNRARNDAIKEGKVKKGDGKDKGKGSKANKDDVSNGNCHTCTDTGEPTEVEIESARLDVAVEASDNPTCDPDDEAKCMDEEKGEAHGAGFGLGGGARGRNGNDTGWSRRWPASYQLRPPGRVPPPLPLRERAGVRGVSPFAPPPGGGAMPPAPAAAVGAGAGGGAFFLHAGPVRAASRENARRPGRATRSGCTGSTLARDRRPQDSSVGSYALSGNGNGMWLGYSGSGQNLTGYLDEWRVYNVALTSNQVNTIYTDTKGYFGL